MSLDYRRIIAKTIQIEGGAKVTDDPSDPGGLTKYGISKRSHPDVDIANLTAEQAIDIYKTEYFDRLNLPENISPRVAWKLFDIAVNMGVSVAEKFVRDIVNGGIVGEDKILFAIARRQMERYAVIAIKRPDSVKYLLGWTRRAFDLGEDL